MTILLLSIIAAMLFFAAIVITNITRISVERAFGDKDIGELLEDYLSKKLGQKKNEKNKSEKNRNEKNKNGDEKSEPPRQDCAE